MNVRAAHAHVAQEPSARYLAGGAAKGKQALTRAFDLMATAPGGVARLRNLILSLGVTGRLLPQDADTGSSVAHLSGTDERDHAFPGKVPKWGVPTSWTIVAMGAAFDFLNGYAFKSDWFKKRGVKLVRNVNVLHGQLGWSEVAYLDEDRYEEFARFALVEGDVLITLDRPIISTGLKHAVVKAEDLPCLLLQRVARISPRDGCVTPDYLKLWLNAPQFVASIDPGRSNGVPHISTKQLAQISFPLPPLAEQYRIVTRVEELMRLCDAMEAKGKLADAQHARLVSTLFDALTRSQSPQELAEHWQRISTHFDLLLDRPEAIDALEQTILQLAVRGLLVPQDPRDEPASELLARIRAEKDKLIADGNMKRDKALPVVTDGDVPYLVPASWSWARMGQIAESRLGKMLDKAKNTGVLCRYLRNTNVQWHRFDLVDVKEIRLELHELEEYRLRDGDLLICEGGEPGRCAIWQGASEPMYFQKALHRVRPLCGVLVEYVEICLKTDAKAGALHQYFTGATIKHFAGQELNRYCIPLPPVAEQHRIVTRVQQLRALCAQLCERLHTARATQSRLAQALVDQVAAA